MSLLADLLSKAKNEPGEKNTVVPPHLESIITRASARKKKRGRFMIIGVAVLCIVCIGFGAVYYMNTFLKPSVRLKAASGPRGTLPMGQPAKDGPVPSSQGPAPNIEPRAETPKPAQPAAPADEPKKTIEPPAQGFQAGARDVQKTARPATIEEPVADLKTTGRPAQEKGGTETTKQRPVEPARYEKQERISPSDRRKADRDAAIYSARNYEESGNLTQAIQGYRKALALDGKNYIVMTGLAGALIKTGAYAESVQYSRLALNTNRNYVPAIINLAIASIRLGDISEGEQGLLRARSLEPGNRQVLYNLGLLYENRNRYPEASEIYEKLAGTGSPQGPTGLGRVLEKQGKREEAKKVYRDILASSTADPKTRQYANERLVLLGN